VVADRALLIGPAGKIEVSYWPKENRPFMANILVFMETMWTGKEMVVLDLFFGFLSLLLEDLGSKALL
jgi:hypothetical protein